MTKVCAELCETGLKHEMTTYSIFDHIDSLFYFWIVNMVATFETIQKVHIFRHQVFFF